MILEFLFLFINSNFEIIAKNFRGDGWNKNF